jgi:hypothetical protein
LSTTPLFKFAMMVASWLAGVMVGVGMAMVVVGVIMAVVGVGVGVMGMAVVVMAVVGMAGMTVVGVEAGVGAGMAVVGVGVIMAVVVVGTDEEFAFSLCPGCKLNTRGGETHDCSFASRRLLLLLMVVAFRKSTITVRVNDDDDDMLVVGCWLLNAEVFFLYMHQTKSKCRAHLEILHAEKSRDKILESYFENILGGSYASRLHAQDSQPNQKSKVRGTPCKIFFSHLSTI